MNKKFITLLALFTFCLIIKASNNEWLTTLCNSDIIDSIVVAKKSPTFPQYDVYQLYYKQPLNHDDPNGERFQLRCTMAVRNDIAKETCANELYVSGYEIDDAGWTSPAQTFLSEGNGEIASHCEANMFKLEHRYFSKSSPENCWEKLDYCNAKEAAQDFHAILEVLKTVFKGKWLMTGTSKGGITTVIQHAYFPDDADIYVPKSAPFCNGLRDTRIPQYIVSNGWEETTRSRFNTFIRELLDDTEALDYYRKMYKSYGDDIAWKKYFKNIMEITVGAHANTSRNSIDDILTSNETLKQEILSTYDFSSLGPTAPSSILNARYVEKASLDAESAWTKYMPAEESAKRKANTNSISLTEDEWNKDPKGHMAYDYQACLELGRYDFDIRLYYDEGTERYTKYAVPMQQTYESICPAFITTYSFLADVQYDNHALFDMVEEKTQNATKPIIFIYGEDDAWAGAAMEDKYINGNNVRKYILDAQPHNVIIEKDKTSKRDEIWALIDEVMSNSVSGISQQVTTTLAENVYYNINGQKVSGKPSQPGIYIKGGRKVLIK